MPASLVFLAHPDYPNSSARARQAVERARTVLALPEFYARIAAHRRFDYCDISPAALARLLEDAALTLTVRLLRHRSRKVMAWVDAHEPRTLKLNLRRMNRTVESIVGTIVHELVHAVDHTTTASFGHGNNSSVGKANTAPYWIGTLAIELAASDARSMALGVLEAFGDEAVACDDDGDAHLYVDADARPGEVQAAPDSPAREARTEPPLGVPPTLQERPGDLDLELLDLRPGDLADQLSDDDLEALDRNVPEELEEYADLDPEPLPEEEEALAAAPPDRSALPFAIDWRGKKLSGIDADRQTPHYGRFRSGMPAGLCLHFPVAHVWSKSALLAGPDRLRRGVDQKVRDGIAFARRRRPSGHTLTYYIIDYLGRIHQDCDVDAYGVHGHEANRYTQGVEITCAGRLVRVGANYYRSFDVEEPYGPPATRRLKNPKQPPFPAWARRTVGKEGGEREDNIVPGTYALFTPAQIRGIFRLHAALMYCDRGRGIYRSEHVPGVSGVTSHDVHNARKRDVGGSLFVGITAFGKLLQRFVDLVRTAPGDYASFADLQRVDAAFDAVVLTDPDYRRTYAQWDDEPLPVWA